MSKSITTKTVLLWLVLAAAPAAARAEGLRSRIDTILASEHLKDAKMSVRVVELPRGRVLYSYHSEDALSVASNAKIVTTAAALDLLGEDFELSTTLLMRGEVSDGTLYGDLIIVGKGDPSISEHFNGGDVMAPLERFAREAAASGIKTVSGDIIANDLYFDRQFLHPSWPDDQWIHWYEPPVGALAFNDNCADAIISPGRNAGQPALIRLYPDVGYVNFTNNVKTTLSRARSFGFYRGKFDNNVTAKGHYYARNGTTRQSFTIHDPSLYLAAGLRKALADAGVAVQGGTRRMAVSEAAMLEDAGVIAVNRVCLADAVKYCNLNSQNLFAEMILKTLGREVEGEGSFEAGAKAVARFLEKAGIKPGEYQMADGSGLAREGKFSAKAITEVLKYVYKSPHANAFRDSLPLSGYAGSLSSRLAEAPYRGKVRAKTGYILRVSALSGYALTASGKTVAFSIIFDGFTASNRYTIKPIQDEICRALVDSSP